jgi:hypothetical protein
MCKNRGRICCKEDLEVSSTGEEKQLGNIPSALPCKQRRRPPTSKSDDFFTVTAGNSNYLKVSHCNANLEQVVSSKIKQTTHNSLNVFHQNIRGLQHKMVELICMLYSCDLSPRIICLTEHFLTEQKLSMIKSENYYLASNFSRQSSIGGGVCIYIKSDQECNIIDLIHYSIEKVIKGCATQMKDKSHCHIIVHIQISLWKL